MTTLREHLNPEANNELHMFLKGNKKKTAQMKYDEFVKNALPHFRDIMTKYLKEEVEPKFKECTTVTALEALTIPALPPVIVDEIIAYVDKQKNFNIVEKTYVALDLTRGISTNVGTNVGHMVMHYATAICKAPAIVRSDGSSF